MWERAGARQGQVEDPLEELPALFQDSEVGDCGARENEMYNEEDLLAVLEDPTQDNSPIPSSSSHSLNISEDDWEGVQDESLPVVTKSVRTSRRWDG